MSRLPILMYHSVTTDPQEAKGLTIEQSVLEQQFAYLHDQGYHSLHFSELQQLRKSGALPKKAVIITFDDVYVNQLNLAYPLLQKYNLKATFFIPFKYLGGVDGWNTQKLEIMTVKQLKSLSADTVELGLHSYAHGRYDQMDAAAIQRDFEQCQEIIGHHKLEVANVLAYPYGKYPKTAAEKNRFFEQLKNLQIAYGLRIGNRINSFPFKENYELQRIDIKGEDSFRRFKMKIRWGKWAF